MDNASLFGNALDNAIEATLKLAESEQRLIKLALFEQNHFIVIRVENYYDSRLSKDAGRQPAQLMKRDDQHRHGFGVKSIRHIVQQYGGEVTIRTDNHRSCYRVIPASHRPSWPCRRGYADYRLTGHLTWQMQGG